MNDFKILKFVFEKSKIHKGLVEFTISLYDKENFSEPNMSENTYCKIENDIIDFHLPMFNGEYMLGKLEGVCALLGIDWYAEEKRVVELFKLMNRVELTYEISLEVSNYEN